MEVVGEPSDGVEAVDQANKLNPGVILLDMVMPKKNGHGSSVVQVLLPRNSLIPAKRRLYRHEPVGA